MNSEDEFNNKVKSTIEGLQQEGATIMGVFSTGSRGYHLHCLVPELALLPKAEVKKFKAYVLKKYGADPAKATLRTMIAIEGSPHWKTGKPKTLVTL